ncbi:hypothetical protein MKK75_02305 [Methylobacterium sp. J-030]|uniref:hypothetical protein n=1 Tax=Methylobacterium sp. J-030 TaxID=2836627 RepID=UPI001FBA6C3C|nr:hypothetical protein [Methylobacterium sp. J-030]MCJ2067645.1 hypothetical protein [Methylobacterium sp. J-030]
MMDDPEKIFLASPQWKGAVAGAREGMALKGYTVDDDTLGTVAMSVLIRFIGAGGYEEAAVLETMAMVLSVTAKMRAQTSAEVQH